jgi:hypothetical protein
LSESYVYGKKCQIGLAVGFLSFLHNNNAMVITGAIMMVLGSKVSAFLDSVLVQDYTSGNISPIDARPYQVYGIFSPFYALIVFITYSMLGLGLLVWAGTGTGWSKP